MSPDQIQQKKTLVLSNRIKRAALQWTPLEMSESQKLLLDTICTAFKESNNPPDAKELRVMFKNQIFVILSFFPFECHE